MKESKIESLVRQLNIALIQYGKENRKDLDMTSAQSVLLWHLLSCKEKEIFLAEVFAKAEISKATISVMLKALREKGYLIMKADSNDDRKKKIILTERAYEVQDAIEKSLKKRTECIYRGISEQELAVLENALEKIIANLKQK